MTIVLSPATDTKTRSPCGKRGVTSDLFKNQFQSYCATRSRVLAVLGILTYFTHKLRFLRSSEHDLAPLMTL